MEITPEEARARGYSTETVEEIRRRAIVFEAADISVELINAAFQGVTLGDGTSIQEARLLDDHCEDLSRYNEARQNDSEVSWRDIAREKIESFGDTLVFMNPQGFRFYLPAFMKYSLNYPDSDHYCGDAAIMALSVDRDLDFSESSLEEKVSLFSDEQIGCCISFIEYIMELEGGSFYREDILYSLEKFWYPRRKGSNKAR